MTSSIQRPWPAMMRKQTAAAYLDVSVATFEGLVARWEMPEPITLGNRQSWSKKAIDVAIAKLTGDMEVVPYDWRSDQPLYADTPEDEKWWKK